MLDSKFYKIIEEDSLEVSIPKSSHFSLGTSPYFAHQNGLAIDIYHKLFSDNYQALSPVKGRVIKTRDLIAPRPKFSNGINREYLTLIQGKNKFKIFKILHIKPQVKVGDKIDVGDVIGITIKNGYFAPWSSPHIHLEIRPKNDAIRARGGESFSLLFETLKNKANMNMTIKKSLNFIPLTIKAIFRDFILATLPSESYYKINPFIGVRGRILDNNCIIDGGIPLYKKGIALLENEFQFENLSFNMINNKKIGELKNQRGTLGFVNFNPVKFYLNNKQLRGISLFLARFQPFIKIIPFKLKEDVYEINSTQHLTIHN